MSSGSGGGYGGLGLVRIYVLAYVDGVPVSWLWDDPSPYGKGVAPLLYVQRESGDRWSGVTPLYRLLCELYGVRAEADQP